MTAIGVTAVVVTAVRNDHKLWTISNIGSTIILWWSLFIAKPSWFWRRHASQKYFIICDSNCVSVKKIFFKKGNEWGINWKLFALCKLHGDSDIQKLHRSPHCWMSWPALDKENCSSHPRPLLVKVKQLARAMAAVPPHEAPFEWQLKPWDYQLTVLYYLNKSGNLW